MHSCEATFGYAMLNAALELLIKASNAGLTLLFFRSSRQLIQ